jgi:hypothetical protein
MAGRHNRNEKGLEWRQAAGAAGASKAVVLLASPERTRKRLAARLERLGFLVTLAPKPFPNQLTFLISEGCFTKESAEPVLRFRVFDRF